MSKLLAVLAGALLLGVGIASVQLVGSSEPANATGTTTGTTTVTIFSLNKRSAVNPGERNGSVPVIPRMSS